MKKGRKLTVIFLALMLTSVTLLAGCGGSKNDYSTLQQDVIKGSNVFVTDSDVVFFGYDNLLCTALFKDGEVYDYVVEAGFTGNVYSLAVYDGALYVSASDGIFKYDLEMFSGSGTASPVVLWDKNINRHNLFQIYDGKIFFVYGYTLCYIPIDGGEEVKLAEGLGDFEVTSNGIYYTNENGELRLLSPDFSEDKVLSEIVPNASMSLGNGNIYFRDTDGSLKYYSLDKGEIKEQSTEVPLYEYCYPWVNSGAITYDDDDYCLHLITSDGEKTGAQMLNYPDKNDGFIYKDWIVGQSSSYAHLSVIDCTNGIFREYNLKDELAADLSQLSGSSDSTSQTGGGTTSSGGAANYNIMDGFMKNASADGSVAYMYFNDFLLTMPNNDKWSMEDGKDYVTIYLWSAQQEGYGGKLVTIRAYDLNDNSYEQLPSYHVAGVGKNAGVRFIAEYPTDVQWNPNDATQDADYRDLQAYLQKIGEGAVNSPLQTADSD